MAHRYSYPARIGPHAALMMLLLIALLHGMMQVATAQTGDAATIAGTLAPADSAARNAAQPGHVDVAAIDSASAPDAATTIPYNPGFLGRLLDDVVRQAKAPFEMSREEAVHWTGAVLVGTGLMLNDRAIDIRMRPLRDSVQWIGAASPVVTELGGTAGIAGAAAFVGYSLLFGDSYDRRTSEMLAEGLITSTVWTRALKILGGRRRPRTMYAEGYDAGSQWLGPVIEFQNKEKLPSSYFESFPSGHTSTAFTIATILAERYNRTPAVPVIAYSLATLVGISRIVEHQHWASDVFVGACVGYLCGHDVATHGLEPQAPAGARHGELERSGINRFNIRMAPYLTNGGGGLTVAGVF